jgi:SnoaL-like domain
MSEHSVNPSGLSADEVVAIQQLLALYGHAADSATQDLLDEVFTEDAVFVSQVSDQRLEGLTNIKAWFALGKPPHPPAHQTTNVVVEGPGPEVRVRSKFLAFNPETGGPRLGDYEDVVVKTPQGWRIKQRTSMPRFEG